MGADLDTLLVINFQNKLKSASPLTLLAHDTPKTNLKVFCISSQDVSPCRSLYITVPKCRNPGGTVGLCY